VGALLLVLIAVAAVLGILGLIRRSLVAYDPDPLVDLTITGSADSSADPRTLDLLTWNIGYAGLGRDADFVADGGRHLRTGSRSDVEANVAAIALRPPAENVDVVLLQELSRGSYATHGVDVLSRVQEALMGYQFAFAPLMRITRLPFVGNLEVGQGTFSRTGISRAVRHALPSEPQFLGVTLQRFNVLEARLSGSDWVIFNVHLSAFDDGALRRRHLTEVVRLLEAEYLAGRSVVAGGDWNFRLVPTEFPYTTEEKKRAWVRDLPAELVPAGWHWAVDPDTPTNRTLDRPYSPGVNYRSVIDGFLVSPNVEVVGVETLDLDFANSDHNPVRTTLRSRDVDSKQGLS
jgi:endonuclease/exonuclease/phosphatase family metal-dependent hydrolase